jgi:hypothetical protein
MGFCTPHLITNPVLGLQQELANNENENFNAILGQIEFEAPQQRHERLVPSCKPNIKKGAMGHQ